MIRYSSACLLPDLLLHRIMIIRIIGQIKNHHFEFQDKSVFSNLWCIYLERFA